VTDEARGLIDRLMEFMEGREEHRKSRKNKRSEKVRYAVRRAMEGFVGDLLRAQQDEASGGWVYRSLKVNSFSGEAVSYRNFQAVLDSLGNFVEHRKGYQERSTPFDPGGPSLPIRGKASRFRARPIFIEYCRHHGLDVGDINDHFIQDLPQQPLVKRAGSGRDTYGTKVRGRPMRFERAGKALELEQQVRELNEFLDRFDLRGGSHRGYVRIFNQGDDEGFDWNKGGRLYSQGDDCYQRLSQDDRLRMTINGERVCEIDIGASYLTIYHAHCGAPLDRGRDPYELPGLPAEARGVIKLWFVATFGNNGHLDRWPREIASGYREAHGHPIGKRYPLKRIREKALQQFPLLEQWGTDGFGWADLMFIESEAMLGAMSELMSSGIPSLTVHDSLIVPLTKREIAQQALSENYLKQTGIVPVLRLKPPSELAVGLPSKHFDTWSNDRWIDEEGEVFSAEREDETNRDRDDFESFGLHESQGDSDPYSPRDREDGEAGSYDQARIEDTEEAWPSDEEEKSQPGEHVRKLHCGQRQRRLRC
jgi:hypothetical protein